MWSATTRRGRWRAWECERVPSRLTYGGEDRTEHDDLVMALGLACWKARTGRQWFGVNRLPGI